MDERLITHFWSRVERRGPDDCWEWKGARSPFGHGVGWDGKRTRMAHHIAWFATHGYWPPDCACHHCDNPPCCNPSHLFLGSRADNLADMRRKGRGAPMPVIRGEAHPKTPLTVGDVLTIRAASGRGCVSRMAERYGVSTTAISNIRNRISWRHV